MNDVIIKRIFLEVREAQTLEGIIEMQCENPFWMTHPILVEKDFLFEIQAPSSNPQEMRWKIVGLYFVVVTFKKNAWKVSMGMT